MSIQSHGLELPYSSLLIVALPSGVVSPRRIHKSVSRWAVNSLALGDETIYGNGLYMPSSVVHASAQVKSTHEGFYPILWDNSIFSGAQNGNLKIPTYSGATDSPGLVFKVRAVQGSRQDAHSGDRVFQLSFRKLALVIAYLGWIATSYVSNESR